MNRKSLTLVAIVLCMFAAAFFLGKADIGKFALNGAGPGTPWFLPLVLISSLIDSINPCAISVLLITIAFFVSMGSTKGAMRRAGGAYIAGIFVVYILIGLGILQALSVFGVPHIASKVGAVLLVALGIIGLFSDFFPNFPIKFKIPQAAHGKMALLMKRASLPALFALGGFVALCEFPCTGGPYLMILGLLHDSGTYLSGLGYLVVYNLVFVSPLVAILLLASQEGLLERVKAWKSQETGKAKLWGSVAMIALGILIFAL